MKLPILQKLLVLALPLAASSFLASCESDRYQSAGYSPRSESRYLTSTSLPSDYSGDAYYHNNRYYAGGRYEPGTYSHEGRSYNDRYFHNGQYLYGGDYRQASVVTQTTLQSSAPTYRTIRR